MGGASKQVSQTGFLGFLIGGSSKQVSLADKGRGGGGGGG